jgi:hypothetical protein
MGRCVLHYLQTQRPIVLPASPKRAKCNEN